MTPARRLCGQGADDGARPCRRRQPPANQRDPERVRRPSGFGRRHEGVRRSRDRSPGRDADRPRVVPSSDPLPSRCSDRKVARSQAMRPSAGAGACYSGLKRPPEPRQRRRLAAATHRVSRRSRSCRSSTVAFVVPRALAHAPRDRPRRRGPANRLPPAKGPRRHPRRQHNTVLRALRQLRDEGLLDFRRGRGIRVAGTPERGLVVAEQRSCNLPADTAIESTNLWRSLRKLPSAASRAFAAGLGRVGAVCQTEARRGCGRSRGDR